MLSRALPTAPTPAARRRRCCTRNSSAARDGGATSTTVGERRAREPARASASRCLGTRGPPMCRRCATTTPTRGFSSTDRAHGGTKATARSQARRLVNLPVRACQRAGERANALGAPSPAKPLITPQGVSLGRDDHQRCENEPTRRFDRAPARPRAPRIKKNLTVTYTSYTPHFNSHSTPASRGAPSRARPAPPCAPAPSASSRRRRPPPPRRASTRAAGAAPGRRA